MRGQFSNLVKGYVRIRIKGDSYDRFLNLCAYHGIRLWELRPVEEVYEAYVDRKDFKKLKSIVKKSHASVKITERHGLPFFMHRYRKRRIYLVGIASAFALMLWLSAHIWNISIDGNLSQTDDVIFEYLTQAGIRHGMWKAGVDCKKLAADVRNYFTQFAWVAAELKGTRLLIHVKEGILGTEGEEEKNMEQESCSLVATRAGTVVSVYARAGLPAVHAGDKVKKGDLLVSGALPIRDDSGEVVSWQHVAADADIVIQRKQKYFDEVPIVARQKHYTGREKTSWMVQAGDLPFALPEHFDALKQYDLLSELTQCRLSENFYLPLYIRKYTAKEYESVDVVRSKEDVLGILRDDFQDFYKNLQEKGVQLFENDVKIEWNEKSAIASGTLLVGEQAARRTAVEDREEESPDDEYG